MLRFVHIVATALFVSSITLAHEPALEEVTTTGRALNLIGEAMSASNGRIAADDLASRPLLRAGELLEVVPGTAVTQHSGTGKSNQMFLRGFNLDHGTDFAGFVDGVPLNLPSHGHGQGYLDLNPLIPETIDHIEFGKGPYYADVGNFSSAGYARYSTKNELERPSVSLGIGENDFYRLVAMADVAAASGTVLGALEAQYYDGPWVLEEDAHKFNALVKYRRTLGGGELFVSGQVYDAKWTATDQVPERAVRSGLIGRRGNIDPTLGGASERWSANLGYTSGALNANAWAVYSDFELFSNFTYFLEDPINGDQITQRDRRWSTGLNLEQAFHLHLSGLSAQGSIGLQLRHDRISELALSRSQNRRALGDIRDDRVRESTLGLFASLLTPITDRLRLQLAVRADGFWFDVADQINTNSGDTHDTVISPKATLVFTAREDTELYFNAGFAFHSNDARGTVTRIDPASGMPTEPVDPLVRSRGAEIGIRNTRISGLHSTLSLWYLELDSELVFVGDAGTTEASGASERYGIEWSNFYRVNDWLRLDLDIALTQSRFTDAVETDIPNSVGRIVTAGISIDRPTGFYGALRMRHFGDSPLVEDGSVYADSTTVINLRGGYRFGERFELTLDLFNLFDSRDPDISYFFASCLPGDPASACGAGNAVRDGVEDIHAHPVEPRQLRATLRWRF